MRTLISHCLRTIGLLLLFVAPLAHSQSPMPRGYHYEAASESQPVALVVLLPGAGALGIFDDRSHVASQAVKLRTYGLDTLVVDTQSGFSIRSQQAGNNAGDRAAVAASDAIRWARSNLGRTREVPVVLMSWSSGSEAVLRVLGDATLCTELQVRGAVMYYPSNQFNLNSPLKRPAVAFFGEADEVTPAARFQNFTLPFGEATVPLEIVVIPGARHGFDVQGINVQRVLRSLPFFGSGSSGSAAQFDSTAADRAEQRARVFLRETVGAK